MADEEPVLASDEGALSQKAVHELTALTPRGVRSSIIRPDGKRSGETEIVRVEKHDFRNPRFLTELEMRHLRILHEELTRLMEARLSLLLRLDFTLTLSDLEIVSYQDFTDSMKNPTHVCMFKSEPLPGVGLFDISPQLGMTIAARMLGGDGAAVTSDRHLTEIEADLMNEVLMLMIGEWCSQWKFDQSLEPVIIGHEVNGKFLQTCQRNEGMLVLRLKGVIQNCTETIQLGVPVFMIEPLVRRMQKERKRRVELSGVKKQNEWRTAYGNIRIGVSAQWRACEVTVAEILKLKKGDIVPLSTDLLHNTYLCLAGAPAFKCEAGVEKGRMALRIKEKLEKENHHVFK